MSELVLMIKCHVTALRLNVPSDITFLTKFEASKHQIPYGKY